MSAPDLVLLLGGPKPARWPTVGAAGVGAHGRRALSCTRPVATAKAARCAWAALGGSAHRRHEEGPAPPLPRPTSPGHTASGRPRGSALPRWHKAGRRHSGRGHTVYLRRCRAATDRVCRGVEYREKVVQLRHRLEPWISTSSCACRCASSLESSPRLDISSIADTTCCSRPSIVLLGACN